MHRTDEWFALMHRTLTLTLVPSPTLTPNPNPRSRHNILVGPMCWFALWQRSDAPDAVISSHHKFMEKTRCWENRLTSLLLAKLSVTESWRLSGRWYRLVRLTGGSVDGLDPQCTLRLILRSKHHLITLTHHVEEVPTTFHPWTHDNHHTCSQLSFNWTTLAELIPFRLGIAGVGFSRWDTFPDTQTTVLNQWGTEIHMYNANKIQLNYTNYRYNRKEKEIDMYHRHCWVA